MKKLLIVFLGIHLSACVTTRMSQERQAEKDRIKNTVESLQKDRADLDTKLDDWQNEMRQAVGRIEALEFEKEQQLKNIEAERLSLVEKEKAEAEREALYQKTLEDLNSQIKKLSEQVAVLTEDVKKLKSPPKKKSSPPKAKKKGNYTQAEEDFVNKRWKEAALNYQKYRELNPNGRRYTRSTYRMGVCFEELGLKDDAKAFYEEVISRLPNSTYAKQARDRLKKLK